MPAIRLLVWNMEWLNDLFVGGNAAGSPPRFRADGDKPQHADRGVNVGMRLADLRGAVTDLAPDALVIVEGPSEAAELQLFFDAFQPNTWTTHLQKSKGSTQNIGIAVRRDAGKFAAQPLTAFDSNTIKAFDDFEVDTDDDEVRELYRFERRPLYVQVNLAGGKFFRVLGLHLKSKGIFNAYEWSKWWSVADGNRRRILAQVFQMRHHFIEPYLMEAQTGTTPLIVCGDINDGPGMDASEKRLFGGGIERLMVNVWRPHLSLYNALFDSLQEKDKRALRFESLATTSFQDPIFNRMTHHEWIDHILYTDNVGAPWVSGGRVAHTLPDGSKLKTKYKHASDHLPVAVDITL